MKTYDELTKMEYSKLIIYIQQLQYRIIEIKEKIEFFEKSFEDRKRKTIKIAIDGDNDKL